MAAILLAGEKRCTKCGEIKELSQFAIRKAKSAEARQSWCRECIRNRQREQRERYRIGRQASRRVWEEANREKRLEITRAWAARNAERERQRSQRRLSRLKDFISEIKRTDPALLRAWNAQRRAAVARATPPWADREAIKAVYEEAVRLAIETGRPHHVDHIIPLNHPLVCGLHYHLNLQAIPAVENLAKSNRLPIA